MSLKSGIYKHRRTVRRVVAGVVVLCCLWAVYIRYVSPTRVAVSYTHMTLPTKVLV